MAAFSDQLLVVTIMAYLAAMVCYAAEYAFSARPARALVPSGAPGAGSAPEPPEPPAQRDRPDGPPDRPQPARALLPWAARGLILSAAAVHLATVVTRGLAAERVPWGNMYEYLLTATLVATGAWLWSVTRYPAMRKLGIFVAMVNVLLLGLAGMVVYTPVGPLVPALDSYWLLLHVTAAITATGLFLVGFVTIVLYLVRIGHDRGRQGFPFTLGRKLPGAETLERVSFRLHAIGFPLWTFAALIAGPIWAEAAWGRYWGWDPKEVWAFITWIVYAAYLHARATPSVRRTVVAALAVAGWLAMLMNLFGVNLFFEGLHSYA